MQVRHMRYFAFIAATILVLSSHVNSAKADVDFSHDILPILTDHCMHCHGVDEEGRQGGLRLDLRDAALMGGDSGLSALSPEEPADSTLLARIHASDTSERMPPPETKNPLSAEQLAKLDEWIEAGAPYSQHWAFESPQKVPLPSAGVDPHSKNPIDAFVLAKLQAAGMSVSPPAEPEILARRLYLDVIGLPPSPQQLAEFSKTNLGDTLDALLNSERYGEKWGRHWLDIARYSDTNGYEKDVRREQWIYRDWVIDAFNRDMPYNQFIVEQVAGDLLPDSTQQQRIATGFLRNSMINEEGAIVPEQFRMVEMFDRMDCIGKGVMGLSLQCAQCHSHKFDPITHDEYYGIFNYLNNTYEAQSWVYTDDQLNKIAEIQQGVEDVENRIRAAHPDWSNKMAAWESQLKASDISWTPLKPTELGSVSGLSHPAPQPDHSLLMLGHGSGEIYLKASPSLEGVTGMQIEILTHGDLPFGGPGRSSVGGWALAEFEVHVRLPGTTDWQKLAMTAATADFSEPETLQGEAKKSHGPVQNAIDGDHATLWKADRGIGLRNQPSVAVFQFEQPLAYPEGTELKIALHMTDMIGCCRISTTTAPAPTALPVDYGAILAMHVPVAERAANDLSYLFTGWRKSDAMINAEGAAAWDAEIRELWQQTPQALTSVLNLAERLPTQTRSTHLLERGAWDQPSHIVLPQTPAALHPLEPSTEPPRLAFARWLVDPRSPLAARVAVNRVWQAIFGKGLVETPEDFGTRAPIPEYQEMLDWLAVDFMEHGWSQKHLIRTILTSSTYQQASSASPEQLELDPRNRLLGRGPRFRADAEVVRDIALTTSGLISFKQGGPGVIPPVPQNVLEYNYVYPSYWTAAEGSDRYRRTVYGFRKRSMPDPVMSSFDGPNGDLSCARRARSNTPLAALASLNETIFVESARALALRILREAGPTEKDRIEYGFLLCTARKPSEQESTALLSLIRSQRQKMAEGWLNMREIATGNPATLPTLPEHATPQDAAVWTIASRVLLSLDETISKN